MDQSPAARRRRGTRALWAVVVVAFVICTVQALEYDSTRHVAKTNRQLIRKVARQKASIAALRKAQDDSCKNFETLKSAVNDFHGTIRSFLTGARDRSQKILDHPAGVTPAQLAAARLSVRQSTELLKQTHTVKASCAQKQKKKTAGG